MAGSTHKRRRPKKRFFLLVFLVLCVICAAAFLKQKGELDRIAKEKAEVQAALDAARLEKAELTYILSCSQTAEYIQMIAREKLGWVTPEEIRYTD